MDNKLKNTTEKFYNLEKELNLFDLYINDIPVWEYIRRQVHREILREKKVIGQAHKEIGHNANTYFKSLSLMFKNLINNNPFLAEERDIIFYGHQRRKQLGNNNWWDIYCDLLHNETDFDSIHLETHHDFNHYQPAETDNLYYTDLIELGAAATRLLKFNSCNIEEKTRQKIKKIEKYIEKRLMVNIDIANKIESILSYTKSVKPLYKSLLKNINPDIAVIVVGYGKQVFIESCKDLDIPVVELQHGIITNSHSGYSFPYSSNNRTFPDYIFTWGEFWNEQADLPLPDESIRTVGYPFLESKHNQYNNIGNENKILFISQGTIGEDLSKLALKLQESKPNQDIIYKLHPGEYGRWRNDYPWLANSDIEVITDGNTSLYKLFAICDTQIGVYSTALYEGLCFGLNTYLYNLPGVEHLRPLLYQNIATLIRSVEDLNVDKSDKNTTINQEYFFKGDSIKNIEKNIKEIKNLSKQ